MKKLLVLALFCQPIFAAPQPITNFNDLSTAVTNGHQVRAIVDLNKCKRTFSYKSLNGAEEMITGINFTRFLKYMDPVKQDHKYRIAATDTVLIDHPYAGIVQNHWQLSVTEDNAVEVLGEYIDPTSFTSVAKAKFDCRLGTGNDSNGVRLFDAS